MLREGLSLGRAFLVCSGLEGDFAGLRFHSCAHRWIWVQSLLLVTPWRELALPCG